jgi:hypothetical protein
VERGLERLDDVGARLADDDPSPRAVVAADRVVGVGPVEDVDRQRCPDVDQPQRAGVVVVAAEGAASSTTAKAAASTTARACRLFLNNGISVYLRGSEMTSVTLGAGPGLWNQANP